MIFIEDDEILEEFYWQLDWINLAHSVATLKSQIGWILEEVEVPSDDPHLSQNFNKSKNDITQPINETPKLEAPKIEAFKVEAPLAQPVSNFREKVGLDYFALYNSEEFV